MDRVWGDLFVTVITWIVVEGTTEAHTAIIRCCTCKSERERC